MRLQSAVAALILAAPAAAYPSANTAPSGPAAAAVAAKVLGLSTFTSKGSVSADALTVDLGYGAFRGVHNTSSKIRSWKGIPFAQAPVGKLRWQAPQPIPLNASAGVKLADTYGDQCPQTKPSIPGLEALPGFPLGPGSEDCLFVNVFAPDDASANATTKKPVLVWIHGGGYGFGNGASDLTDFVTDNDQQFVIVTIQYRLGAFGFLSSAEIKKHGVLNAGLLDQSFALMWVQQYIGLFGGDAAQVTISGESAGGGSVMYQTMSNGGDKRLRLFQNAITASPYNTPQFDFDGPEPSARFAKFAALAGCANTTTPVFDCLVAADTTSLQHASFNVSTSLDMFGLWAFTPVTDGSFVRDLPTRQLAAHKTVGANILVGNNANEGALFVPSNIKTNSDVAAWIRSVWPGLTDADIQALLDVYSTAGTGPDGLTIDKYYSYPLNGTMFEPDGQSWPTSLDVSMQATGPQQRANAIYGEATFVCTAYYLAEAFTRPTKKAFQYQYSVLYAYHSSDIFGYLGPATPNLTPAFVRAFRQIWGGVVVRSNPSIVPFGSSKTPYLFTPWTESTHPLVNLNTTGGTPTQVMQIYGANGTQLLGDVTNDFLTADADAWEGGRGARCNFLRTLGPKMYL